MRRERVEITRLVAVQITVFASIFLTGYRVGCHYFSNSSYGLTIGAFCCDILSNVKAIPVYKLSQKVTPELLSQLVTTRPDFVIPLINRMDLQPGLNIPDYRWLSIRTGWGKR